MTEERTAAFLVVVVCLWTPLRAAERSVLCRLSSSCVLPCPFDPGPEVVIHWLNPPDDTSSVHSFYHNKDQLGRQQARYRGRTALFKDQISKGNASLSLTGVALEDSGRYKCYTSTINGNNEDFINVKVHAPVGDVLLEEDGEKLKCESRDIFPKPSVSWSPPSDHAPSVTSSESELFSVVSSVPLTQREHICTISTEHSRRSATYRRNAGVTSSGSSTELFCAETEGSIKTLVWTFNRTENILQRKGSNTDYNPDWESRLEKVLGSKLVLNRLSPDQQGLYTCLLITDLRTSLTVTEVSVEEPLSEDASTGKTVGIVLGVLILVALAAAVGLFLCRRKKAQSKDNTNRNGGSSNEEMRLNKENGNSGSQ